MKMKQNIYKKEKKGKQNNSLYLCTRFCVVSLIEVKVLCPSLIQTSWLEGLVVS